MQSFFTHEGETMKDIKTNGFDIVPFMTAQRMEEDGDIERALYAYRYLAEQGEIAAIQKLAVLYHQGEIVEQNFQESVRWLKRGGKSQRSVLYFQSGALLYAGYGCGTEYGTCNRFFAEKRGVGGRRFTACSCEVLL